MTITAVTCACHRPEAWRLSELWMSRQTRQPDQWLVLDDDEPRTVCTMGQEYIFKAEWRGHLSLLCKLWYAVTANLIRGDAVAIWENDDYYAPDYLKTVASALEGGADLAGEGRTVYYNVRGRWWFAHPAYPHASLCATAFTRVVFPHLLRQIDTVAAINDPNVDSNLWTQYRGKSSLLDPAVTGRRLSVGIKGMPGTPGYNMGHDGKWPGCVDDHDLLKLRALVGADTSYYEGFYER